MEGFHPSDSFSREDMASFMRRADIYRPAVDALALPAESYNLEEQLLSPQVWTLGAMYNDQIVGFVQISQRTSIGGEILTGFHPQARGAVAKAFGAYAIDIAFATKGFLKLWAIIPADNKPAIYMARALDFRLEGRLTEAIVRDKVEYSHKIYAAGLRDLLILARSKQKA